MVATGLAIAAAVAFLAATFVLTDTTNAAVRHAAGAGGASVVVTDDSGLGGNPLAGASTLPAGLVTQIQHIPGVAAAEGLVAAPVVPLNQAGHPLGALAAIGLSIPTDPRLQILTLRQGSWPTGADRVVLDTSTAAALGIGPGGTARIGLPGGVRSFTVTGTIGYGSAANLGGIAILGFPAAAAPTLLGTGGGYAAVEVAATPDLAPASLADRIRSVIGPRHSVRTVAQQSAQLAATLTAQVGVIGTILSVFAGVAIVVGALLIATTFTVTIAGRTQQLALLRCVGASRSQVAGLVLAEAGLLGLAGSILGLAGGVGLAAALRAVLGALGLPVPAAAPQILPHTILASLGVGVGVSALAALTAAVRAARTRPLAALSGTTGTNQPGRLTWPRRVAALLLAAAGAAGLLTATGKAPVAAAALALIVGAGLGAPGLVGPLTAPTRALGTRMFGICGRIAGCSMGRNPRRVAAAGGTLAVAVATVAVIATMATTFGVDSAADVTASVRADYLITTPPQTGLDPALPARLATLPGVGAVTGLPRGGFQADTFSDSVIGVDPAALPGLLDLGITAGQLRDLGPDTMAVSARTADRDGWHLGQIVPISYPLGGTHPVRIVALYSYDQVAGGHLIPLSDFQRGFPAAQQGDYTILVAAHPGATAQVHTQLTAALADYPQASLTDRAGFITQATSGIDLLATLMTGLLVLSLLIGLLSVATTLALTILERTREIGLLRAIGATRTQIHTIVRAEAITTVLTGALAGAALGVGIGWALARAFDGRLLGGLGVPWPLLAAVIPAGIAAGLIAAAIPARRASRLNILDALHTD